MPRKLTATTGVVLALVLAGCGSDNSSKTTSQSAAATTPAVTALPTTTSAGKASKSKKTSTTSKQTDAQSTSGSKPAGTGTGSAGAKKTATTKKPATKKPATKTTTTTTSKKPVGVTPATGSGSGSGTDTTGDTSNGTGSGPSSDRLAIVTVLRRYYKAFIDSNGADACAQLTKEGQDIMIHDGAGKTCSASVVNLVKRAGADSINRLSSTRDGLHVNDITVTGNKATAEIGAGSHLRLVQISGRWYLRSPDVVTGNG